MVATKAVMGSLLERSAGVGSLAVLSRFRAADPGSGPPGVRNIRVKVCCPARAPEPGEPGPGWPSGSRLLEASAPSASRIEKILVDSRFAEDPGDHSPKNLPSSLDLPRN